MAGTSSEDRSKTAMMATSMKSLTPEDIDIDLSTKDLYCSSSNALLTEMSLSFLQSLNDIEKQEKNSKKKKNGNGNDSFLDLSTNSWNFLDLEDMVSVETFMLPTPMSPTVTQTQTRRKKKASKSNKNKSKKENNTEKCVLATLDLTDFTKATTWR